MVMRWEMPDSARMGCGLFNYSLDCMSAGLFGRGAKVDGFSVVHFHFYLHGRKH